MLGALGSLDFVPFFFRALTLRLFRLALAVLLARAMAAWEMSFAESDENRADEEEALVFERLMFPIGDNEKRELVTYPE